MSPGAEPLVLRKLAVELVPKISQVLLRDSDLTASTWHHGLETGKTVELMALCSLLFAIEEAGHKVTFPEVYSEKPDLFYLRNTVPRHHGAQVGHRAALSSTISLADRFLAALTPKAIIQTAKERIFCIFREGHPIHHMQSVVKRARDYPNRPDIIVSEGHFASLNPLPTELEFSYKFPEGRVDGSLRVRNDTSLPLLRFESLNDRAVPVNALLECSVGKSTREAKRQRTSYLDQLDQDRPPFTVLINGQSTGTSAYDHEIKINLEAGGEKAMVTMLTTSLSADVQSIIDDPK